ncbi:AhpD-like protein [Annulohypoxylon stygium]|nr:AhpD-like protein [Annulohypoxylon stygium]
MRLQYTPNPPTPATDTDAAIVSRIAARRAPRPLQPLDLALLHAPPVADGWNSFLGSIRERTSLDARVRELAISRVAVVNGAWYEWGHHAPLALKAGVSEAGIAIVKKETLVEGGKKEALEAGLSEGEWAVLRYTDEMTRNVKVQDSTFAELKKAFSEREVVEITATVAAYNCVSRFLVALDVGEKNGTEPDDVAGH